MRHLQPVSQEPAAAQTSLELKLNFVVDLTEFWADAVQRQIDLSGRASDLISAVVGVFSGGLTDIGLAKGGGSLG